MGKEVGPLLKSYQEEIDRLTTRAKLGESAFLDVYQRLYEAPDPAAALMAGLVRYHELLRIRGTRPRCCLHFRPDALLKWYGAIRGGRPRGRPHGRPGASLSCH